jgi:O-antigen ligase
MTPPRRHMHFSIAALCLMLTLPFINPHHYNPIPTFYQEWTSAALGLMASTLLLRHHILSSLRLPAITLAPLGLGALLLVQLALGRVEFLSQGLLFLLYLLWSFLLIILGRSIREDRGLEGLCTPLATAILAGAVLTAGLRIMQLSGMQTGYGMVYHGSGAGNLAQSNHLANYLWMGLASTVYLRAQKHLGNTAFATLAIALIACASLTGSRSVLLYAAGLSVLAAWAAWRYRYAVLREIFLLTLFLCLTTALLQIAFSSIEFGKTLGATISGERFYQEVGSTSARLQLWRTGLAIFIDRPWLGAGIGQFPWQAYLLMGAQPDGTFIGGAEHAHNLLIDLLAEFGLFAPLIILTGAFRWWIAFSRQAWRAAHWWLAAVLLVLAMHSQLEYPLWYAYFLGIAALLVGAGSSTEIYPKNTRLSWPAIALILLLGGLTLFNLFFDYRKLEHALNWQLQPPESQPTWHGTLDTLSRLHGDSLFSHYVDLAYAYQLPIDRNALKEKIQQTERAMRFSPIERSAYKLAYLLALDGRPEDTRVALYRAIATHPQARNQAINELTELKTTYPELQILLAQLTEAVPQR